LKEGGPHPRPQQRRERGEEHRAEEAIEEKQLERVPEDRLAFFYDNDA